MIHYSQITLKLVLAYGVSELVGFVQLPWHGNQEARLVESTFGLLYDLVRSLRGVVIFFTYICKRSILKRFRNLLRPAKKVDEIVGCADIPLGVTTRNHRIPPHSRRNPNPVGKVISKDTTNVCFSNQACSIDEEEQANKDNESREISRPKNNKACNKEQEDESGEISRPKNNQACNKQQENESGEIAPPENNQAGEQENDISPLSRALSIAKAIGAELVINSEDTLDTKCNNIIEKKEQQSTEEIIIYV